MTNTGNFNLTTRGDREIVMTRVFNAPRKLVFDAFTKPELVKQWLLGPPGWSMPVCEIDLRVGGRYRYVWRNDDKGAEFGVRGDYREIDAPKRIVHNEQMDGVDGDALCTLTLSESGGRTTLSYNLLFESKEKRDRALESGMTDGMAASFD